MKTSDLIDILAADAEARPVRRLASPLVRSLGFPARQKRSSASTNSLIRPVEDSACASSSLISGSPDWRRASVR